MRIPTATYRLQFNKEFGFEDARAIVPYLHDMGISDIYASPLLRAREGSSHGYDVADPTKLNPDLGSEEEFELLTETLNSKNMGLLLDIVPNHMVASPENPWWKDLLENGELSPYAKYFDIDWHHAEGDMQGKMQLPIIGTEFDQAIDNGEFALMLEETGLSLRYHDYTLPLDIKSYATVLSLRSADSKDPPQIRASQQLRRLVESMAGLPDTNQGDTTSTTKGYQTRQVIKKRFLHLIEASTNLRNSVIDNIRLFNRNRVSNDLLKRLIDQQAYKLEYWKNGIRQFNYRRFFNITELVGIRVEDPQVFEDTHTLILELAGGRITGLRIDHIDGLH
ncbi:MAG: alpha-amylase family glycosyl hydrolase, partial [Chloroflexota bacterium]|nr:alpha-amylase family glycosyl hydrolase [Chloroflexota bacterium]